jgi:alkylated DNA nucleotide flippase Atl1
LIGTRVSPHHILAISFTNKACKELSERLVADLGARGRRVRVCTFHKLALRLMREAGDEAEAALLKGTPAGLRDDAAGARMGGVRPARRPFDLKTNKDDFKAFWQLAAFEEELRRVEAAKAQQDTRARFILPVSEAQHQAMLSGEVAVKPFNFDVDVGVWHLCGSELEMTAAAPKSSEIWGSASSAETETDKEKKAARALLTICAREWEKLSHAWIMLRQAGFTLLDLEELVASLNVSAASSAEARAEARDIRKLHCTAARMTALCIERGFVFMHDLVPLATQLVRDFSRCRAWIRENVQSLLVDEWQDSSSGQFNLIVAVAQQMNKTAGSGASVTAVGDHNQCIYSFQGSMPDAVAKFRRAFPGSTEAELLRNYRSQGFIVEFCNNFVNESCHMFAQRAASFPVQVVECRNVTREAEFIIHEIVRLVRAGATYSEIAVLVRTQRVARQLGKLFRGIGMPFKRLGATAHKTDQLRNLESALRAVAAEEGSFEELAAVFSFLEVAVPQLNKSTHILHAAIESGADHGRATSPIAARAAESGAASSSAGAQRASPTAASGTQRDSPSGRTSRSTGVLATLTNWVHQQRASFIAHENLKSAEASLGKASKASGGKRSRDDMIGAKQGRLRDAQAEYDLAMEAIPKDSSAAPDQKLIKQLEAFISRLRQVRRTSISSELAVTISAPYGLKQRAAAERATLHGFWAP